MSMSKELETLMPLELWQNFIDFVDAPTKARLLDCEWKDGLKQYDYFKAKIETALKRLETLEKDFMSLTETNMELVQEQARNQRKLKALKFIKDLCNIKVWKNKLGLCFLEGTDILYAIPEDDYELLKEVL